jgi:hemoglobin
MLEEIVDRETVGNMVRSFYAKLIKDKLVGPYFVKALGSDLKNDQWFEHYHTLENFWLQMVEGEEGYYGNPFVTHVFIGELYVETFERWLSIFKEHVYEHYVPEVAEKFVKKSEIVANRLMEDLEIR